LFGGMEMDLRDGQACAEIEGDRGRIFISDHHGVGDALLPLGGIHQVGQESIHHKALVPRAGRGGYIRGGLDGLPKRDVFPPAKSQDFRQLENIATIKCAEGEPSDFDPNPRCPDAVARYDERGNTGSRVPGAGVFCNHPALGGFIGAFATGIGVVFSAMTIALFTFYFTADHQRIQRLVLSWFAPERQERLGWTWDQAVEQTGAYFYSRLILMLINGLGFFFTMVLVGLPWLIALPLAIFAGFVSEFIPAVGTYIGGAVPVLMALALQGFAQALIVLAYVLIYQQI
jgi:hypothetical protein